jgi:hypothetical protein
MAELDANELRAYLVKLAAGKVEKGILQEPRAYYDIFAVNDDGTPTAGNAEIFRNGEDFPVMLKHVVFGLGALSQDGKNTQDPRNIGFIGVNFRWHDQFYMNPSFNSAPSWGNVHNAGPQPIVVSTAAWKFPVPFIMSARDTLKIDCQALVSPPQDEPFQFQMNFNGIGMLSGRPYVLSGQVNLPDQQESALPTQYLRNDGGEPIVVVDGTANLSSPEGDLDPQADISQVAFNVRQIGAGTNAQWFQGPNNTGLPELMPAHLFGVTMGRVIVHKFPGDGMMLNPGEAFSVAAQASKHDLGAILNIAAFGYLIVT